MIVKKFPAIPKPMSRMDWHNFYAKQFNKTGRDTAATMAVWYLLLTYAFGERD